MKLGCKAVLLALVAHGSLAASEVVVQPVVVGPPEESPPLDAPEILVRAEPHGTIDGRLDRADSPDATPIRRTIEDGEVHRLDLHESVIWSLRAEAPGYWSTEEILVPGEHEGPLVLRLYPTARVTAPVEPPRHGAMPEEVELHFEPDLDGDRGTSHPQGMIACPVSDAVARCEPPARRLDLRFAAPPYAPVYRLGVAMRPGEPVSLEPLEFTRGASVSGFVVTGSGDAAPEGTKVELRLPGTDDELPRSLRMLSFETTTRERGFFQLRGVRPGVYRLVAKAGGYAPARIEPIETQPDLESVLDEPVVLHQPVRLEVAVAPARDPWGEPWRLRVAQLDSDGEGTLGSLELEPAPDDSTWIGRELAPDAYRLTVLGSDDTRWLNERIEVSGGEGPLHVEIPLVEIEGTVTRGDEPAPGRLWFGTSDGERRIVFEIDEEGQFGGRLAGPGRWRLEWVPPSGEDSGLRLEPVEIPDRDRVALEIEIPDTEITGEVVDEQGQPVADARVRGFGQDEKLGPSSTRTDEKGRFSIVGLEPGDYAVRASRDEATSDMVPVTVDEGRTPPDLRLVLRERHALHGWVRSSGRPVAGARITAWPDLGSGPGVSGHEAVSDPEGHFELEITGNPSAFNFLVIAPGFATRMTRLPLTSGDLVEIELDPVGGTLVLSAAKTLGGSAFLAHDGSFLPVLGFHRIAQRNRRATSQGDTLVIADLEAGRYALCTGPGALAALRGLEVPPSADCAEGVLTPHGRLALAPSDAQSPSGRER